MKNRFFGLHLDFIGFSTSLLCAIHCAALPILFSLTPLTGLQFLNNPWIEYCIILLSFFIATGALIHGYRNHHEKRRPLFIAIIGFILIIVGHLLESSELWEIVFTSFGGVSIAIAHFINWKYLNQIEIRKF